MRQLVILAATLLVLGCSKSGEVVPQPEVPPFTPAFSGPTLEVPPPYTPARNTEEAAAAMRAIKAVMTHDEQGRVVSVAFNRFEHRDWVTDERLQDLVHFTELQDLNLGMAHVSGEGLKRLSALPRLAHLNLSVSPTDDLKPLAALTNLESLSLSVGGAQVADASLRGLATLPHLRRMRIYLPQVTDDFLRRLSDLKALKELELVNCDLSAAPDLSLLTRLPKLTHLGIGSVQFGESQMRQIAAARQLTSLHFANLEPTNLDAALKHLTALRDLTELRFVDIVEITDAGLKYLAAFEKLTVLDLSGTRVTDAAVKQLAAMKRLRRLHVPLSDDGLAALREALPDCEVSR
jgi:Leucine-rich repeat (LRR) protein